MVHMVKVSLRKHIKGSNIQIVQEKDFISNLNSLLYEVELQKK